MRDTSIRAIVLENAVSPKPMRPRDLARHKGIKLDSIYRTNARLRKEGILPPTVAGMKGLGMNPPIPVIRAPLGSDEKPTRWVQQDVDDIVNSEVMPELERLQKLSNMARFGPDAISIAAIRALEDLNRARGQSVGPGKPLTEDEQVARLARLCLAVGRDISVRAMTVAFPEANVELSTQTSQEHEGPSASDSSVGGLDPSNDA